MRKGLTILSAALMIVALVTVSVIGAAPANNVTPSAAVAAPAVGELAPQPVAGTPEVPAGPVEPAAAPDKLIAGQRPGAYYLDYGGTVVNPNQYPIEGSMRMFGWSALQSGTSSYNWAELDKWIADRFALGLSTGVFISTYDGKKDGDIRSTPDFVIQKTGAMITYPETYTNPAGSARSGFADYYQYQNGNFESSWHPTAWDMAGDAQVVDASSIGGSWAGRLGGVDNSSGSLTRYSVRVPAMPPEATGVRMELQFRTNVQTSDLTPNADHLYVELLDASNNVLASLADITNSSGANNTWVVNAPINLNSWMARTLKVRFRSTTDGATPTTFYVDDVQLRVRLIIPRYWSTAYKDAYRTFVTALGDHLKNDSRVDFVAIGTGLHGETQPSNYDESKVLADSPENLTSALWVQTANEITDMYVAAFTQSQSLRKNLLLQYAPYFKLVSERKLMTDHAVGRNVGLSYNGLLPDWVGSLVTGTNEGTGAFDPMVRNNRYNFVPIAWETYTYMLCTPVFTYWSLFSALDKHTDYIRIGDDLLQGSQGAENTVFFQWAKDYWGKTLQTTKSVWTVMREHRNPTPYCHARTTPTYAYRGTDGNTYVWPASKGSTWPQLGNYNFWLKQDDAIAGGRTVPETNDKGADSRFARDPVTSAAWTQAGLGNCPTSNSYASPLYPANYPCNNTPYNADLPALGSTASNYYAPDSWVGTGKEAWVVRRTDQATGNPYMWFWIDPQYIDGSKTYSVTISVKYFDIGTDTWSLRYDSASGVSGGKLAGTVTKTNSKQLREKTFNISDAKFAKRLASNQADFVIDSNSDGNEWIHMVDLAKKSSFDPPPDTPTPSPTPTVTLTPSATPTATPTTGVVEGYAFWDKDADNMQDPDDPGIEGAVIVLKQGGAEVYSATSGPDGKYRFGAVTPGQYFLSEKTPPPGYLANVMTVLVAVSANQTFDQIHFGHQLGPTSTPTATATPTSTPTATATPEPKRIFLPLMLRDFTTP